ncbi:nucleotidyltransferase [Miniphocaeibacter halophilus]|uniref:Nucleotidyltransferase n=1 Tax=Miniphocaeibacter halophilus TaxID=2931922 RepID=A0AC61MT89_9FIRM|nr:nucleotidyltransferase [Miniphocaeibacter halophilus]QQK07815.1 nucleotidyltransferase [Miniphocaeibacter halophilus]
MKTIAIISEYNPLHTGHLYQIAKIKEKFPQSRILAIMSGNFVQRGEPAIFEKFLRTKYAIENGIDLVVQLPTIYSLQSAENFALGGVKIIKAINCIDYISFGVESENISELYEIAKTQVNKAKELSLLIERFMLTGKSYAASYKDATISLLDYKVDENIFLSNNILALEYIKSILKLNLNIELLPVLRQGNNYLEENLTDSNFNSATSIRNNILKGNIDEVLNFIPYLAKSDLKNYHRFTSLEDYFELLKYNILITKKDFYNITGYEEGLDNLFFKNIIKSKNMNEFIDYSISKRYKKGRIQRFILNYLLNIEKKFIDNSINTPVKFIKVLGLNNNGKSILKSIKKSSNLNIVTKNKDFILNDSLSKSQFDLEITSTDLYNIKNQLSTRELQKKVYIKEDYK